MGAADGAGDDDAQVGSVLFSKPPDLARLLVAQVQQQLAQAWTVYAIKPQLMSVVHGTCCSLPVLVGLQVKLRLAHAPSSCLSSSAKS
jgi:hypothetical protein